MKDVIWTDDMTQMIIRGLRYDQIRREQHMPYTVADGPEYWHEPSRQEVWIDAHGSDHIEY